MIHLIFNGPSILLLNQSIPGDVSFLSLSLWRIFLAFLTIQVSPSHFSWWFIHVYIQHFLSMMLLSLETTPFYYFCFCFAHCFFALQLLDKMPTK